MYSVRIPKPVKGINHDRGNSKGSGTGQVYMGKVVRITSFGAFVEFLPGKEGLVHISKLSHKRVAKVEDVVNIMIKYWSRLLRLTDRKDKPFRKDAMEGKEEK